jgi:heme o synthase
MTSRQTTVLTNRPPLPVRCLGWAGTCLELAKAKLTALVLLTTAVGYAISSDRPAGWSTLLWALLGTSLVGCGANGLNQCLEAPADRRMLRTRGRPVAAGRIRPRNARDASLVWVAAGTLILAEAVNLLTAGLAVMAVMLYVLVYTPLKQRSSVCTLIGAVVGAIPPMMGVTAATGRLDAGAWILAALLFTWQIPHSLALAWLYRDDYERGGYRLLVWQDRGGRWTFHMIVLYCLALLPIGLTLSLAGFAGTLFAIGAIVLGSGLLAIAVQLSRTTTDAWARRLFLGTVIYLPVLLALLLMDR